jgi:DNA-binding MarR family transcriptional regulator
LNVEEPIRRKVRLSNEFGEGGDLYERLIAASRRFQQGTDMVDQVLCEHLGINRTDARCLDILQVEGRMAAGELANAAGLSPGAATTAIDRLAKAGYARRIPDRIDRRRVYVEATELSHERAAELMGPMGPRGAERLREFTTEQLEAAARYLEIGAEVQREHAAWLRERRDADR